MSADIPRDSAAGDSTNSRADFLDRAHQRQREEHRPKQAVAILGAGLRVRGDATGIIVRCAGDEAGAQSLQEAGRLFGYGNSLAGMFRGKFGHAGFRDLAVLGSAKPRRLRAITLPNPGGNWQYTFATRISSHDLRPTLRSGEPTPIVDSDPLM